MPTRADSRPKILDAAAEIIRSGGISSVTFDAVATAAGLSRAGVTYHFRSRDDLLLAVNEHMAARFHEHIEPLVSAHDPADDAARCRAVVESSADPSLRAGLQLLLELHGRDRALSAWSEGSAGWVRPPDATDPQSARRFIAQLSVLGLLTARAVDSVELDEEQLEAYLGEVLAML